MKTLAVISGITLPEHAHASILDIISSHGFSIQHIQLREGETEGCRACGKCIKLHQCMLNDHVNDVIRNAGNIQGIVVLSPVFYGIPAKHVQGFLDRLFNSACDLLACRHVLSCFFARTPLSSCWNDPFSPLFQKSKLSVYEQGIVHQITPSSSPEFLYALIEGFCIQATQDISTQAAVKRDFSFLR